MFVKGDASLDFRKVAEVIDFGHQAEVDNIGLITPAVEEVTKYLPVGMERGWGFSEGGRPRGLPLRVSGHRLLQDSRASFTSRTRLRR